MGLQRRLLLRAHRLRLGRLSLCRRVHPARAAGGAGRGVRKRGARAGRTCRRRCRLRSGRRTVTELRAVVLALEWEGPRFPLPRPRFSPSRNLGVRGSPGRHPREVPLHPTPGFRGPVTLVVSRAAVSDRGARRCPARPRRSTMCWQAGTPPRRGRSAASTLGSDGGPIARENGLEIPAAFWLKDAQVAQEAGMAARAVESVTRYLTVVGQGGEAYREALVLLDAAEAATATKEVGQRFRDCLECPEMVVLPGGSLAMGRYEVTVGEYGAFASATGVGAAGGCLTFDPSFAQTDRHPVLCMRWDGAQDYVSWLSRRTGATFGCRRRRSGSVRLPVLSLGATGWGEGRGRMGRALSVSTVRTRRVCRTWLGTCGSGLRTAGRGTAAVVCCAAAPGATLPSTSGLARAAGPPSATGPSASVFAFRGRWIKS